jgi:hypothetical protein
MIEENNNNKDIKILLLNNVKNKNILKKIFENIQINKFLTLIRYNKTLQRRLNKTINDYIN